MAEVLNPHGRQDIERQKKFEPMIRKYIVAPKRILSFGCGHGHELVWLQELFPEATIIGVEINKHRAEAAREKGFEVWREIDLSAEKFDFVIAFNSFMFTRQEITQELKDNAAKELEKIGAMLNSHKFLFLASTPVEPLKSMFAAVPRVHVGTYDHAITVRQEATKRKCLFERL